MEIVRKHKGYGSTRISVSGAEGVSDEDVRLFVASQDPSYGPHGERVERGWEDDLGNPLAVVVLHTD